GLPRSGGERSCRPRAQPEQRLVERAHQLRAVAVQERLDQRAAQNVTRDAARALAAQLGEDRRAVLRRFAEQDRGPERRGPPPVFLPEERGERIVDLA